MKKEHAEKRIAQIVAATTKCIAENGYENLTVQSMSDYSGLSKGAINHYFKTKQDVLVAVLKSLDRRLFEMVDEKVRNTSVIDDHMRYRLSITLQIAKDDPIFMYLIMDFLALAMNNPVYEEYIKKFLTKYRYLSSVGLRPGLKSGEYKEVNPESIGAIVMALVMGIGMQWIVAKGSFDFDEVAKIAEDMIILYLRKDVKSD